MVKGGKLTSQTNEMAILYIIIKILPLTSTEYA